MDSALSASIWQYGAEFTLRLKPAGLLLLLAPKSKQNALFRNLLTWALTATSDTAHTSLFGRSNSLREFCSRAPVTGLALMRISSQLVAIPVK